MRCLPTVVIPTSAYMQVRTKSFKFIFIENFLQNDIQGHEY